MRPSETITMAMRELDRLKAVQAVVQGELKPWRAARRLGLSTRQVRRLAKRYRAEGPAGLVSRRRGRPSNHRLPEAVAERALALLHERYADFGPTLACEKLREVHGLELAKETVRKLMCAVGLWIPRAQRPAKVYQPRARRDCLGELIQIDGSEHRWFEGRGPMCTALVFVDDATSRLMQLLFTNAETTFGYFEAMRTYLQRYGKPLAFYSDKASIFRVNHKNATAGDGHTQFARALYELNIDTWCANTSQAKGRVERAHQTLQDRLVKELRLKGISCIEAANAFVPAFMEDYNGRFAKPPKDARDAHRALRADEDLELIFTWREPRRISGSLTLQYDKRIYLLEDDAANRRLIGKYVEVYEYPDGRIEVRAAGRALPYALYDKLSQIDHAAVVDNKRLGHALRIAQALQEQRDDRRGLVGPSSRHRTGGPSRSKKDPTKKTQRGITMKDLEKALPLSVGGDDAHPPQKRTSLLSQRADI
jgi:transposase